MWNLSSLCVLVYVLFQQPAASKIDPVYAMDYGPFLAGTISAPVPKGNVAIKGVAVRLGDEGGVLFDTELLRVAGGWTGGFLDLVGTPYDGAHGPHPSARGRAVFGTRPGPGWAQGTSFTDPRAISYGPLPGEWGRYHGLYLGKDRVVVSYSVDGAEVREAYAVETRDDRKAIARTIELGASKRSERLRLCERDGAVAAEAGAGIVVLRREPPAPTLITSARTIEGWDLLATGSPSHLDYADQSAGHGVTITYEPAFSAPHRPTPKDEEEREARNNDNQIEKTAPSSETAPVNEKPVDLTLPLLNDGLAPENADDPDHNVFFEGDQARIVMDLKAKIEIARINTFSWHESDRAPQHYVLYASDAGQVPGMAGADPAQDGWTQIAEVDTTALGGGGKHGVAILRPEGLVTTARFLLFDVKKAPHSGTFFSEIDVFQKGQDCGKDPREETVPMVTAVGLASAAGARLIAQGDRVDLEWPASTSARTAKLLVWDGPASELPAFAEALRKSPPAEDLAPQMKGGIARWPAITQEGTLGKWEGDEAYVVDTITAPVENPFHSRMRLAAFDFFSDGRAALSTWNGDVWVVSGIDDHLGKLTWKRFATGLFDPLGLRIVNDEVYTLGRDQITRLHDLNGDGEADFYENFNHDVLVTDAFHEFAFDLQTDGDGNFYFSKAGPVRPGGRGFEQVLAHHGSVMKVSKDGSKLEVYATGFRAPNGIGVSPTGQVTTGDNEGTWMPRCRLNWVTPGGFYGCVPTAHRSEPPQSYDPPLCFMPMNVDNSGGGQVWVPDDRFGPFKDRLLHLSYGQCELYLVLAESADGVMQGGVVRFPLSFASSLMRGRFNPRDGQLYVVGFKGWQTRAARDTAFQRVRYTGKPTHMPTGLHVTKTGVSITFTEPLDRETAEDPQNYSIEQWNYMWTERYGSPEVSLLKPIPEAASGTDNYLEFKEHDPVSIASATLSADHKTVFLEVPGLVPVMQMKISINVDAQDGTAVKHEIYNTINRLGPAPE